MARSVRARVRNELWLADVDRRGTSQAPGEDASQVAKPDGLVVVNPETELEFLHKLPVALMWGVGPATEARLAPE